MGKFTATKVNEINETLELAVRGGFTFEYILSITFRSLSFVKWKGEGRDLCVNHRAISTR